MCTLAPIPLFIKRMFGLDSCGAAPKPEPKPEPRPLLPENPQPKNVEQPILICGYDQLDPGSRTIVIDHVPTDITDFSDGLRAKLAEVPRQARQMWPAKINATIYAKDLDTGGAIGSAIQIWADNVSTGVPFQIDSYTMQVDTTRRGLDQTVAFDIIRTPPQGKASVTAPAERQPVVSSKRSVADFIWSAIDNTMPLGTEFASYLAGRLRA
jgi:hypothetical protein